MIINFFKKHWFEFSIFSILLVAVGIRFYQLGFVPHGMTWDEAAIGYNGFAIFNTRRDEWLVRLPVSFKSFGDFKAPLAIYLNGFFTYLFGMNLFAVRLPFAIASIFSILGMILLTQEILDKYKYGKYLSLFSGFLLALSPWHIHYSRAGFESGLALAFTIFGILFLVKAIKNNFKSKLNNFSSVLFFIASIYTYHSSKIVVPLLGLTIFCLFFNKIKSNFKQLVLPALLFILGLIPFIKDSIYGDGLTRAGVTIFSSDLSIIEKLKYVFNSFVAHLSPNFLLLGETTTLRHGTSYLGVLFVTTYFLVIVGIIAFINKYKGLRDCKYQFLFIILIIIGILPAAIALEIPHSNRALLALPGFILTATFGLKYLITILSKSKLNNQVRGTHSEKDIVLKSVVGTIIAVHIIFSIAFINNYFYKFSKLSTNDFNDGYLEAFALAEKYEKGEGTNPVDRVIFTSQYGQPYIYALFVRETNPIWYRGGSLIKYEFTDKIDINDLNRVNTLVVGSGTDGLPTYDADHVIYGADNSVRFQIFRTN